MEKQERQFLKSLFREKRLIWLWIAGVLGAVAEFFLANGLNGLVNYLSASPVRFVWNAVYLTALSLVIGLCRLFTVRRQGVLKQVYEFKIVDQLIQKAFTKKTRVLEQMGEGSWLTLSTSDANLLAGVVPETVTSLLAGISSFVAALIFGFSTSWLLTCAILVLSLFSAWVPKITGRLISQTQQKKQVNQENMQETMLQVFDARALLYSFFAEKFGLTLFKEKYEKYTQSQLENAKSQWKMTGLSLASGFVFDVTPLVCSIYLISINQLTLGQFMGFNVLNANFTWVFYQLPGLYANWLRQKVSLTRIVDFLEQQQVTEIAMESMSHPDSLGFKNVSFRYTKDQKWVLKNADFFINLKSKDKVLLTGESGTGKTTAEKLLMGFYRPTSGNIEILKNEKVVQRVAHRELVSYVPQKTELFSSTLRENILLGRELSDKQLAKVVETAELTDLVTKLPDGLASRVSGGDQISLSAGQLQKIGLARALVEERPLLVLDEPTANLDQKSENDFLRVLKKLPVAILMVSHRPNSTAKWLRRVTLKNEKIAPLPEK